MTGARPARLLAALETVPGGLCVERLLELIGPEATDKTSRRRWIEAVRRLETIGLVEISGPPGPGALVQLVTERLADADCTI